MVIWLSVMMLSLIWGSTWLAIKTGLRDAPPFFSAALRFIIAVLFLLGWMRLKGESFPAVPGFWKRSALLASVMFVIPYAFVYLGEMHVSSGLSSVLFSSQALFVVLCSHYMLKNERATPAKWAGIAAGMAGLVLIFSSRFGLVTGSARLGMLGIVAGAFSAAFALVWLKKTGGEAAGPAGLTAQLCVTAAFFAALSLCTEGLPADLSRPRLWLCAGYLGVPGTALAFLVYYWLTERADALTISLSVYLTPVLALFLGWALGDERVGFGEIAGTGVVLCGIAFAQRERGRNVAESAGEAPLVPAVLRKPGLQVNRN